MHPIEHKHNLELDELDREWFHKRYWPGDVVRNPDGKVATIVDRLVTYLVVDDEGTQMCWQESDLRK